MNDATIELVEVYDKTGFVLAANDKVRVNKEIGTGLNWTEDALRNVGEDFLAGPVQISGVGAKVSSARGREVDTRKVYSQE